MRIANICQQNEHLFYIRAMRMVVVSIIAERLLVHFGLGCCIVVVPTCAIWSLND